MHFLKYFSFTLLAVIITSCGTRKSATASSYKTIEEKYAHLLGTKTDNISNKKLYSFIDEWYGSPYQYGGKTKKGVDCSGFASLLLKEVFGKEISGSSSSFYKQSKNITKSELKEGDLVFFKIDSKEISHVGVYLQNNKFVHATTKAGVMIDDLDEDYYKKYFVEAGRFL